MTRHLHARAIASIALLVLAACAHPTPSTSSPTPRASALPSSPIAPSGTGTATDPSPSATATPGGEILQVVADELRMRAEAGIDASLVDTLFRGALVRLDSEPVEADGYRWREIVTLNGRVGWVADGDASDPWLAELPDLGRGTPLVTLGTVCDVTPPLNPPATVVMDDGWVVAVNASAGGGWVARQLSSDGLDEVQGAIRGSPYLQRSADYLPQPKPGAVPPAHGACQYTFTIPTVGGEPIVVSSVGWFGDEEESTFYQPSPERRTLDTLAGTLTNIAGVLDDEAWTGRALPYVADEFVLRVEEGGGPAPVGAPVVDVAALGLGDLDAFGAAAGAGRCGTVPRAQAFELARMLNQAEPGLAVRLDMMPTPYFATDERWFGLVLGPRLPGGEPRCPES